MISYVSLGSNLADPAAQLTQALSALKHHPDVTLRSYSSLYHSKPVGPQDQPDFINAAACLETKLSPIELLDALQQIEQQHQRVRERHWGPRTLDLDIICCDDLNCQTERLTLPHPFATERGFVLVPLREINAKLTIHGYDIGHWLMQVPHEDLIVHTPFQEIAL